MRDMGHPMPVPLPACLPGSWPHRGSYRARCPQMHVATCGLGHRCLFQAHQLGRPLAGQRLPRSSSSGPGTCPKELQSSGPPSGTRCARRRPLQLLPPGSLALRSSPLLGRPVAGWQHRPWAEAARSLPSTLRSLVSSCHTGVLVNLRHPLAWLVESWAEPTMTTQRGHPFTLD